MKRKFLEDLGLEKDVVDKIMDENGRDIEAAKLNDTPFLEDRSRPPDGVPVAIIKHFLKPFQ